MSSHCWECSAPIEWAVDAQTGRSVAVDVDARPDGDRVSAGTTIGGTLIVRLDPERRSAEDRRATHTCHARSTAARPEPAATDASP